MYRASAAGARIEVRTCKTALEKSLFPGDPGLIWKGAAPGARFRAWETSARRRKANRKSNGRRKRYAHISPHALYPHIICNALSPLSLCRTIHIARLPAFYSTAAPAGTLLKRGESASGMFRTGHAICYATKRQPPRKHLSKSSLVLGDAISTCPDIWQTVSALTAPNNERGNRLSILNREMRRAFPRLSNLACRYRPPSQKQKTP